MTKPLSYLESYLSSPQISLLKNKKTKHHEEMDHTSIQRFGLAEKKKKIISFCFTLGWHLLEVPLEAFVQLT